MKRLFLSLAAGVVIASSFIAGPQSVEAKDKIDQRCFTAEQCLSARNGKPGGFYQAEETKSVCGRGEGFGFCLPAGEAFAGIKIAGQNKFTSMGDYIQLLYNFIIALVSVIAVIIIIGSGLRWSASGGNPSIIASAKKRIASSLIGILIAVGGYTILSTVNPYLVNLRLPQIWMVNNIEQYGQKYCVELPQKNGEVPKVAKFTTDISVLKNKDYFAAYAVSSTPKKSEVKTVRDRIRLLWPPKEDNTRCGEEYIVQGTQGGQTCMGTSCTHMTKEENGKKTTQICIEDKRCEPRFDSRGGVGGEITWKDGKYADDVWLYAVCEATAGVEVEEVDDVDIGDGIKNYTMRDVATKGAEACGDHDKVLGYLLLVEVNDTGGIATNDDQWLGGISLCKNITTNPSCGFLGMGDGSSISSAGRYISKDDVELWADHLASIGELIPHSASSPNAVYGNAQDGFVCDLNIDPDVMKNIGSDGVDTALETLLYYGLSKSQYEYYMKLFGSSKLFIGGNGYSCPRLDRQQAAFNKRLKELANSQ